MEVEQTTMAWLSVIEVEHALRQYVSKKIRGTVPRNGKIKGTELLVPKGSKGGKARICVGVQISNDADGVVI